MENKEDPQFKWFRWFPDEVFDRVDQYCRAHQDKHCVNLAEEEKSIMDAFEKHVFDGKSLDEIKFPSSHNFYNEDIAAIESVNNSIPEYTSILENECQNDQQNLLLQNCIVNNTQMQAYPSNSMSQGIFSIQQPFQYTNTYIPPVGQPLYPVYNPCFPTMNQNQLPPFQQPQQLSVNPAAHYPLIQDQQHHHQ